jgi:hypothetical protein
MLSKVPACALYSSWFLTVVLVMGCSCCCTLVVRKNKLRRYAASFVSPYS